VKVVLNGVTHELPERSSVAQAVIAAGAAPDGRGLAVAVEGEVVPRRRWESVELGEGQRVEVLHAVQGGA
jgi:sulfur carrier protein